MKCFSVGIPNEQFSIGFLSYGAEDFSIVRFLYFLVSTTVATLIIVIGNSTDQRREC
jgi:hypothetical protein